MREIKFRAFDPVAQEMKSNPRLNRKPDGTIWASVDEESGFLTIVPLMQFTGLKDKNGVEIYEGDIVIAEKLVVKVVEWESLTMQPFGQYFEQFDEWEVIGNIYQNPELVPK